MSECNIADINFNRYEPPESSMNSQLMICQLALEQVSMDESQDIQDRAYSRIYQYFLADTELNFEDLSEIDDGYMSHLIARGMILYKSGDYVQDKVEADSMRVHLRDWTGLHIPFEFFKDDEKYPDLILQNVDRIEQFKKKHKINNHSTTHLI